ncbi:MAG: hypothetical protein IKX00_03835 [Bacilli bacterium]|nr:hypothetical protein [Bacilli bacterium]
MIPDSEEMLVPSYDEILDMNNHFPEMNMFISKKERQYMQICENIDKSSKTDAEKKIEKNTYYIYLMIIKKILVSKDYKCSISITGTSYKEITLDSKVYKLDYDFVLLHNLVNKNDLSIETYYGDGFISTDLYIKTQERV